ncbi:MAG: hypothetical protein AAF266_16955, partial [Planctomycetota bacterium]
KRFKEAVAAADAGQPSRAFQLATAAVLADPDHAEARRVMGYEAVDGDWLTPYQQKQRRRGYQWSGHFGWVKAEDLPRYRSGERRVGRRWVSAKQDAATRERIEDGWTVRTDHFVVTTNHSLEEGVRLAAELESLFQVWRQWFAGYWLSDREVRDLFNDRRDARVRSRPMQVYYHRDKAAYVAYLRRLQPRIAETLGIYFDDRREAHFFAGGDDAELARATLHHEAAHQLFTENGPGKRGAGRLANFWLIEGIACYFELLAPANEVGRYTFGDPAQGRLPSAVARGPVLPLGELTAFGQSDLQRLDDLAAVYAQSTGVVTMLRHGRHADTDAEALVRTLREVYSGRPDGEEIARQTGRSLSDLDLQYRRFLANLSP